MNNPRLVVHKNAKLMLISADILEQSRMKSRIKKQKGSKAN